MRVECQAGHVIRRRDDRLRSWPCDVAHMLWLAPDLSGMGRFLSQWATRMYMQHVHVICQWATIRRASPRTRPCVHMPSPIMPDRSSVASPPPRPQRPYRETTESRKERELRGGGRGGGGRRHDARTPGRRDARDNSRLQLPLSAQLVMQLDVSS